MALLDTPTKFPLHKMPSASDGMLIPVMLGNGDLVFCLKVQMWITLLSKSPGPLSSSVTTAELREPDGDRGWLEFTLHCNQFLIECFSSKADNPRDCSVLWIIMKLIGNFLIAACSIGKTWQSVVLAKIPVDIEMRPSSSQPSSEQPCNELSRVLCFLPTFIKTAEAENCSPACFSFKYCSLTSSSRIP